MVRKRSDLKSSSTSNKNNNSNNNDNNDNSNTTSDTASDKARSSKGRYPPSPWLSPSITTTTLVKAFVVIVIAFVGQLLVLNHFIVSRPSQSLREDAFSRTTDNGGWRKANSDAVKRLDSSTCNIERVSVTQLDPDRFEREYRFKKPVIVTFPNGVRDWTDPEKWTVDSLKRLYGERQIKLVDSMDIILHNSDGVVTSSFDKFVDHTMEERGGIDALSWIYMFDKTFYPHSHLPKTFRLPPYFSNDDELNHNLFLLGASGSGVVFHRHHDAWNAVVYGRKRWFIYPITHTPPGGSFFTYPILDWHERVYPNLTASQSPLECVQQGGEVLYVPESFYHATINIGNTVAVAREAKNATTEIEKLIIQHADLNGKWKKTPDGPTRNDIQQNLLDTCKKLKQLLPESSRFTRILGQLYGSLGDHDKAVEMLSKTVEMDPYYVTAYISLGHELDLLGRVEEAERALTHAIKLSPKTWMVYSEYGEFLLERGRYAEVLPILRKVTELNPKRTQIWLNLKTAQEMTGDTEGARETQKKIDELNQGVKDKDILQ